MAPDISEMGWAVAIVAIIVVGALMYAGTVGGQAGLLVIAGVLGAVGVYERRARIKTQRDQ